MQASSPPAHPAKRTRNVPAQRRKCGHAKPLENQFADSPIVAAFKTFATTLDDINDRRERLVKISRDVTISSKRLIFLLHRYNDDPEDVNPKAESDLKKIRELLEKISIEIENQDYFKYVRAFSPGVQEYIEAASFYEYLRTGTLISKEKLEADIQSASSMHKPFRITNYDYLGGIGDLTGELMRLCVNSVATRNGELSFEILEFLQSVYDGYSNLPNTGGDFAKKLSVMKESLQKVENVCVAIRIRGSEYPQELLASMAAEFAHSFEFRDRGDKEEDE